MYAQYLVGRGELAGEHRVEHISCVRDCFGMKEAGYYVGINKIKPSLVSDLLIETNRSVSPLCLACLFFTYSPSAFFQIFQIIMYL